MRAVIALAFCITLFGAVIRATEIDAEADTYIDVEVAHPTLPGLGSPCYPKPLHNRNWRAPKFSKTQFLGVCTADSACVGDAREPGYCAGIDVVCCKHTFDTATATAKVEADVIASTPNALVPAVPVHEAIPSAATVPVAAVPAPATGAVVPSAVPVLQSSGASCTALGGTCKDKSTCAAPSTTKSGLCPGAANILCCVPPASSAASKCASQGGVCKDKSTCTTGPKSGLCPGAANIQCCFPAGSTPPPSTGTAMTALIRIPAGINKGTTIAGASFLNSKLGTPGCPLTTACFNCNCAVTNARIKRNLVTASVTPNVRITGLKPFVDAIKRALDAMKAAGATRPELLTAYNSLRTAGGLCCRPIKKSNGSAGSSWSNHSWGAAVDFYFGSSIDPRGDGKAQYGLSLMAPFFNAQKLYWAAGYSGSSEDAMHFEASQEALNAWTSGGLIP